MYVPNELVDFKNNGYDTEFINNQVKHIKELVNLTNGRCLLLTTSKEFLEKLYIEIYPYFKQKNIRLMKQGESSIEYLTSQFKDDETSTLIGSGSFFSGFSVKGMALISVIITKLPFPIQDDPFLKLLGEGYEDDFFNVIIFPYMMIKLNQGVGRLIRDINDYGVLTILDPRMFDKEYGLEIRNHFNKLGYKITREFKEINDFLEEKRDHKSPINYPKYSKPNLNISANLTNIFIDDEIVQEEISDDKISQPQKKFCRMLMDKHKIPLSTTNFINEPYSLYKRLYDELKRRHISTEQIENEFPFSSPDQLKKFKSYKGAKKRKNKSSKVKKYGMSGTKLS